MNSNLLPLLILIILFSAACHTPHSSSDSTAPSSSSESVSPPVAHESTVLVRVSDGHGTSYQLSVVTESGVGKVVGLSTSRINGEEKVYDLGQLAKWQSLVAIHHVISEKLHWVYSKTVVYITMSDFVAGVGGTLRISGLREYSPRDESVGTSKPDDYRLLELALRFENQHWRILAPKGGSFLPIDEISITKHLDKDKNEVGIGSFIGLWQGKQAVIIKSDDLPQMDEPK